MSSAPRFPMAPWLLWTLLAVVSWGLWAVLSKLIGPAFSAAHSQALSTLGLVPVIVGIALSKRLAATGNRPRGIALAFAAGVITCLGNTAYYHALNSGAKAATVIPLTALYPLITIALAVLLLREKLSPIQLGGVALSLASIYLFNVQREEGLLSSAVGYALLPVVLWGVAGFLQKVSTNEISGELSALAFLAAFVPVAAVILWREPLDMAAIAPRSWLLVILLGLFFALGNFALLAAFASHGKASIIAPLAGLYPVVSVPIAILFLGEKVGPREIAGIVLALVSVAALAIESSSTSTNLQSAKL